MAEKWEALRLQAEAERAAAGPKPQVVGGTKYVDVVEEEGGAGPAEGARVA